MLTMSAQSPESAKCPHRRQVRGLLLLLSSALLLQRSEAQSTENTDYSFRIALPPLADQNNGLSLPELPIYDRDNRYLELRDSSRDWYDANILNEEQQNRSSSNLTFSHLGQSPQVPAGGAPGNLQEDPTLSPSSNIRLERESSLLLDADKRIQPELRPEDVLLDESLAPIPPLP